MAHKQPFWEFEVCGGTWVDGVKECLFVLCPWSFEETTTPLEKVGRKGGPRDLLKACDPTGVPCRAMNYPWDTKTQHFNKRGED